MKIDEDPHPLNCVVMTIFQGEMNPNRTLYGRLCQSRNERLFPVGGMLMYPLKEVINIYRLIMNLFHII